MTAAEFTEYLIAEIEAGNQTWVEARLAAARDKIAAGGGEISPLVGASLNNKTLNRQVLMPCHVVAKCCRDALRETAADQDNGPVSGTCLDFSELHR